MAKRSGKSNRDSETRVEEAIKRLLDAHREGCRLLRACPIGKTYGQGLIDQRALEAGTNPDALRKLRAFADVGRGYSQKELQGLCNLCRKHRRAVGFSIVVKLLTVSDKKQRAELQRRVISEAWSLARIEQELVKRFGRRRQGGRRPRIPDTVEDFLADLETRAIGWQRLCGELRRGPAKDQRCLRWADLPDNVQADLAKIMKGVDRLRADIADHLRNHSSPP